MKSIHTKKLQNTHGLDPLSTDLVLLLFLMAFYAIIFCNIDMAGQCQIHVSHCFWRQADLNTKTTSRVRDNNKWQNKARYGNFVYEIILLARPTHPWVPIINAVSELRFVWVYPTTKLNITQRVISSHHILLITMIIMKMMKMTKVKTIDYNHYKNNLKFVIIIIIDFLIASV